MNSIIMGGQWGDEGKGKIVDLLSRESNVVARYTLGPMLVSGSFATSDVPTKRSRSFVEFSNS
mgnify:CR=1 FL=1